MWIFFSEPIAAADARRMGSALLTETMERRPEIGFESYDRLFYNQDTIPSGGFGNWYKTFKQRGYEHGNAIDASFLVRL